MGIRRVQGVEIRRKPRMCGRGPPRNKGPEMSERGPTLLECTTRLANQGERGGCHDTNQISKIINTLKNALKKL